MSPAEPLPALRARPFIACLQATRPAFALFAHAGANVLNDYYDAASGADDANAGRIFPFTGGSRFIQNGVLSAAETARLSFALLAAVVPAGLWLTWMSGPGLLLVGAAGLLLGWAYTAPPLALVSRGLGEATVAAGWLLVVIGCDFVQRHAFSVLPLRAGLSYALLVAAILFVNEFPDHLGDAAAGKRTLVVRLGPPEARWLCMGVILAAYAWLLLMVGRERLPHGAAAAALSLIVSFRALRHLLAHTSDPAELAPAVRLTIAAALLHGLLLAATLAFGRWPG